VRERARAKSASSSVRGTTRLSRRPAIRGSGSPGRPFRARSAAPRTPETERADPRFQSIPARLEAGHPRIGWSPFAQRQNTRQPRFEGRPKVLLERVAANWHRRQPGTGYSDRRRAVVVPVDPAGLRTNVVPIRPGMRIYEVEVTRRPGEAPYLDRYVLGEQPRAGYAGIALYSRENLRRSGDAYRPDAPWQVVAVTVGPGRTAPPMHPATLRRNASGATGGTRGDGDYERALRRSERWWKRHVKIQPELPPQAEVLRIVDVPE
jgi:hypothetical protein